MAAIFLLYLRGLTLDNVLSVLEEDFSILQLQKELSEKVEKPTFTLPLCREEEGEKKDRKEILILNYAVAKEDGSYALIPYEKRKKRWNCLYCVRKIEDYPIGIPLDRKEGEKKITLYCIDRFDTFPCTYAELLRRKRDPFQRAMYEKSELLLKEWFKSHYPQDELHPALDQRLLRVFGGPMSWKKYHSKEYRRAKAEVGFCIYPVLQSCTIEKGDV